MWDDKTDRAPRDRSRINVEEDYEVRYWAELFGVAYQQLRGAVQTVGVSADKVREYLRR